MQSSCIFPKAITWSETAMSLSAYCFLSHHIEPIGIGSSNMGSVYDLWILLNKIGAFFKRSHRYGFVNGLTEIQPLFDSAMESLFCLLITAFKLSSNHTDLSAMYSGSEVIILSCPDVLLICINDLSSLTTLCLNLLICELAFTCVFIVSCNLSAYMIVMCKIKSYLLTYLLT